MASAVLQGGGFANVQELFFHTAKPSDMGRAERQVCVFADCQEWHFQAAKRSDKSNSILQECRFADAQESRIQTSNLSKIGSAVPPLCDLLMLRNGLYTLLNVQMCALPS